MNLDVLVLSETKLTNDINTQVIASKLSNWNILKRYDAKDRKKHMGLLLLSRCSMHEMIKKHYISYKATR